MPIYIRDACVLNVCCVLQAVQVMTKICAESERSLDYYGLFKQIMKRAPVPMSPLESLASSAVRTAHKVRFRLMHCVGNPARNMCTCRIGSSLPPLVCSIWHALSGLCKYHDNNSNGDTHLLHCVMCLSVQRTGPSSVASIV